MEKLDISKITKNNKYIDTKTIKEVMAYAEQMKPYIKEQGYNIGVNEEFKNSNESSFIINTEKQQYLK